MVNQDQGAAALGATSEGIERSTTLLEEDPTPLRISEADEALRLRTTHPHCRLNTSLTLFLASHQLLLYIVVVVLLPVM
ncbi:hypothetical protein PtB15_15B189 [Puccinia triticina]|nr:hypothetical protein PtB15_15B189 [Puccinia triticina]